MPTQYVKPFVLGGKNDATDAAAICATVRRPDIRTPRQANGNLPVEQELLELRLQLGEPAIERIELLQIHRRKPSQDRS